jgi:tRNA-splicing ligase RtcB
MIPREAINQLDDYLYEIPASFRSDMRVPARLYTDAELLEHALGDESVKQLVNTATLPGVVEHVLAMPDVHQGYGFPIGGVVATALPDGVISPGGVGYDINCGVRLLGTHMHAGEVQPHLDRLATAIYSECPSGVGQGGEIKLKPGELERVLVEGSRWAKGRGFARDADLERTEQGGRLEGADAAAVSARARERGRDQVGTLGAGNHFIEVDVVRDVFDEPAAQRYGLFPGQVAVQVHCGSRGLGHQVCSDYVSRFQRTVHQYGIHLPTASWCVRRSAARTARPTWPP